LHVFEALHDTGGVLRYRQSPAVPSAPKRIVDSEVENLRRLGVEVECNVIIAGRDAHRSRSLWSTSTAVFRGQRRRACRCS